MCKNKNKPNEFMLVRVLFNKSVNSLNSFFTPANGLFYRSIRTFHALFAHQIEPDRLRPQPCFCF